jgi:hypothetical protein
MCYLWHLQLHAIVQLLVCLARPLQALMQMVLQMPSLCSHRTERQGSLCWMYMSRFEDGLPKWLHVDNFFGSFQAFTAGTAVPQQAPPT